MRDIFNSVLKCVLIFWTDVRHESNVKIDVNSNTPLRTSCNRLAPNHSVQVCHKLLLWLKTSKTRLFIICNSATGSKIILIIELFFSSSFCWFHFIVSLELSLNVFVWVKNRSDFIHFHVYLGSWDSTFFVHIFIWIIFLSGYRVLRLWGLLRHGCIITGLSNNT